MKNSMLMIAMLFGIFALGLSSCDKTDDDDDIPVATDGSFTLTVDGTTATEVVGQVVICPDGFIQIIGKATDGSDVTLSCGKILVGETRQFCGTDLNEMELNACLANSGVITDITANQSLYFAISGTATRPTTKDLAMSGTLNKLGDVPDGNGVFPSYPFTLEATAGLVSPFNCE